LPNLVISVFSVYLFLCLFLPIGDCSAAYSGVYTYIFGRFPSSGTRAFRVNDGELCSGIANRFGNCSTVSFGGEDPIFIYLDLFSLIVFHITLLDLLEEMVVNSQSAVKFVTHHPKKIGVVKFDGTNNFDMWRCEVMDVLTSSKIEDALLLEERSEETSVKDWDKMNRAAYGIIRSYLIQDIKYHMMT